jgi:hypothetical protein
LADEPAGLAGLADAVDEVIGTKILVGRPAGDDVPDGDEDRVFDSDERALLAPVADQAAELGGEVGVLRTGGCRRGVAQDSRVFEVSGSRRPSGAPP